MVDNSAQRGLPTPVRVNVRVGLSVGYIPVINVINVEIPGLLAPVNVINVRKVIFR